MARLWEKRVKPDKKVIEFTVGKDYILDERLVKYDCISSMAHAEMLEKAGILTKEEKVRIVSVLKEIIELHGKGKFEISSDEEDCHTKIENYLTEKLGETGKKIHTARSRNDQVVTALRLYYIDELKKIKSFVESLKESLKYFVGKYGKIRIPGFTHTRKAMVATVKMWGESFIDALDDDLKMLDSVINLIDQSPLGTGAGFGIPVIKIDRKLTQKLLGFRRVQKNPIYVQSSRGKFEAEIVSVISMIAFDLNKLSTDIIWFSAGEMKIFEIPDEFTTGSSIMPHKKNPDVFEIARANYSKIVSLEMRLKMLPANLISGYHRDLQLTKEAVFESFDVIENTLKVMSYVMKELRVDKESAAKLLTEELYATEEAYKLVKSGMPFRTAYRKVSEKFVKSNSKKNQYD